MDAKLSVVVQHYCHLSPLCHPRHKHRSDHSPSPYVVAVLSRSPDKSVELSGTMASRTVYKDTWFDRAAINHLSQRLQETTGLRSSKSGYDGLVEAAGVAYRKFNSSQQQDLIIQTLEKAFPRPILSAIRALLPQSKFAREFFAVFTTIFFAWLVGPCEVRESEFDGTKEKNVVHIKKCRFLEGTNCVGMCTNLCKMSSQEFIKDSLGMPLNMVPNFDDMSCDMIFGQEPPLAKRTRRTIKIARANKEEKGIRTLWITGSGSILRPLAPVTKILMCFRGGTAIAVSVALFLA